MRVSLGRAAGGGTTGSIAADGGAGGLAGELYIKTLVMTNLTAKVDELQLSVSGDAGRHEIAEHQPLAKCRLEPEGLALPQPSAPAPS